MCHAYGHSIVLVFLLRRSRYTSAILDDDLYPCQRFSLQLDLPFYYRHRQATSKVSHLLSTSTITTQQFSAGVDNLQLSASLIVSHLHFSPAIKRLLKFVVARCSQVEFFFFSWGISESNSPGTQLVNGTYSPGTHLHRHCTLSHCQART